MELTGPAQKALKRIPAIDRSRILKAFEHMKDDPFRGDVRKLHGGLEGFRQRIGDWRVFFDVYPENLQVVVNAIVRRTSTTY